ncbi:tagatose 6-phosphate kinase [Amycolatopsis marina]|uniref:Tagatose 6-phosphate kinase n=1 Tax=Amycolatopsis marina TaxID=490629 RepID=A0A1I0WL80_9PSEU|nr:hexose kinase [Amycolatopsis marina]SFA89502.1 tagatose 6-phosphate kinase [Amycolatopsis marina]
MTAVVTVTPNPAIDVTYAVDELTPGTVHRVTEVTSKPGGKGLNVARVLGSLDVPVIATGLVGGTEGAEVAALLAGEGGIVDCLVTFDGATRRTVTVVDGRTGAATLLSEPGPVVRAADWAVLLDRVGVLLRQADVLVCSGSLPPGAPPGAPGDIVRLARAAKVAAIVDTSGPGLLEAVAAGASVVKPNADELRQVTGVTDPLAAAVALRSMAGAPDLAVVASLGADGLIAVTEHGAWRARLPSPVTGNATGAGDSVVAALARGLRRREAWPTVLRSACALSAATVRAPVAGDFDADSYNSLLSAVTIREMDE